MEKNVIITISRQFGSNGREIARKLAEYLDISYYDIRKRGNWHGKECDYNDI